LLAGGGLRGGASPEDMRSGGPVAGLERDQAEEIGGAYGKLFRRERSRPTWPWRPGGGEQRLGAPASPCGCGCRWCRAPGPKAREGPGRPVQRRERVGRWLTEAGVDRTRGETRPAASSVEIQPLRGRGQGRRPRIGSWCSDEAPAGSGRS
jgi:hypothetical protein